MVFNTVTLIDKAMEYINQMPPYKVLIRAAPILIMFSLFTIIPFFLSSCAISTITYLILSHRDFNEPFNHHFQRAMSFLGRSWSSLLGNTFFVYVVSVAILIFISALIVPIVFLLYAIVPLPQCAELFKFMEMNQIGQLHTYLNIPYQLSIFISILLLFPMTFLVIQALWYLAKLMSLLIVGSEIQYGELIKR